MAQAARFVFGLLGFPQAGSAEPSSEILPQSSPIKLPISKLKILFGSGAHQETLEPLDHGRASSLLSDDAMDGKTRTELTNGSPGGSELEYSTARSRFSQPEPIQMHATPPTASQTSAYFSLNGSPPVEEDDDLVSERGGLRIIEDDDELAAHETGLAEKIAKAVEAVQQQEKGSNGCASDRAAVEVAHDMGPTSDLDDKWPFEDFLAKLPDVPVVQIDQPRRTAEQPVKEKHPVVLPVSTRKVVANFTTNSDLNKEFPLRGPDAPYMKPRKQRKSAATKRQKKMVRLMMKRPLAESLGDFSLWQMSAVHGQDSNPRADPGLASDSVFSTENVGSTSHLDSELVQDTNELGDINVTEELDLRRTVEFACDPTEPRGSEQPSFLALEKFDVAAVEDSDLGLEASGDTESVSLPDGKLGAWAQKRKRFSFDETLKLWKLLRRRR